MSYPENLRPFREHFSFLVFLSFIIIAHASRCLSANNSAGNQTPTYRMKEVVVTATKYETAKQDIAANIEVVTHEDIENWPVSTVAEVLQYIPGVYMEFNGGLGSFATIRIQGSETRHVAVCIDGVPLNQLANPLTDLSFIPIDSIERIEVYKGAASSAWGSALGGVVNIITRDPDPGKPISGNARISYGEFDTLKSRGSLRGTKDRFGYLLSFTHDQTDGFTENTSYQQNALYAKVHYDIGDASRLSFVFSDDDGLGADPSRNKNTYWSDSQSKRTYQRLLFETEIFEHWSFSAEARHHRYSLLIEEVYQDRRDIFNDYADETWGGGARLNYSKKGGHNFNIGFDGNLGSYDWQNYDRTYHANNWALWTNDTLTLGTFTINAGIRYDNDDTFGGTVSPSAGLVYHLWQDKALLRLQVSRGFSAPPAAWVDAPPPYGNRNLKPEVAMNYQLGFEIEPDKKIKFALNLFRADVDNLIQFDLNAYKFLNIDKVVRQGVEGSITINLPFDFSVSLNGTYVDVRNGLTGEVVRDIPPTLFTLRVSHQYHLFTHTLIGTYVDNNSSYAETMDKVFVFNYHFNLQLPFGKPHYQVSLFGSVYNVTDVSYVYRYVWPKPRRWAEGGVIIKF